MLGRIAIVGWGLVLGAGITVGLAHAQVAR